MRLLLRRFHLAGALYLLALIGAAIAGSKYLQGDGSTIIVTSTADSGPGSLRQAFADANDGDTIQFDPALNGQTITLTSAELAINKNITISGPGPGLLTVARNQQAPNFRIFHPTPGHTVVISGLTITGGRVGADGGAGVMNDQANLTIDNCTISANIFASSQSGGGSGGGIRNRGGTLNLVNSTVSANEVRLAQGGSLVNGGGVGSSGALTITNITNSVISGNSSDFHGGGIINDGRLTITDSVVNGNHAGLFFAHSNGFGGGIHNGGSGILTIRNSVISSNVTSGDSSSGIGGGIYSQWTLAISDSTISDNSAPRVGGGIYGYASITNCTISGNVTLGQGGGIFGGGTITNCTISGNSASQGQGGGIYGGGNITSSTIAGNTASQGGGIYATNGVQLGNTILKTGTSGANILNNGGSVTSLGYNLSSDNGAGFLTASGDQINTDPLLGPLQDNGGPTFTRMPMNGSPAIDAGNPNFTPPPLNDQRGYGYVRVYNGRIDIGSLEVQPTPTLSPTPTATATATFAPSATPCAPLLTQSSTQTITTGNSVSCNNGNGNTANSYWRAFNMAALTGGASYGVNSVSFGVESVTHPASVTIRLYSTSNFPTGFPGSLTQLGMTSLNVNPAQNGTVITAPLLAAVPAGTPQLVMELFTPDGQTTGTLFYVGSNADPETAPSYLSTATCGLSTPVTLASIGFPDMHIVFNVNGSCTGATPTPSATASTTATATATATVTIPPTPTPTATPTPLPCTLTEGFENITTLIPNGWVTQNNSQPVGTTGWFQGNPYEDFAAQSGSPASCIAANFLDGSGLAIISNWLLTPPVTLQNGAKFSFWTTTVPISIFFPNVFPDRLQVRMSTNGTSQDVGSTATSVGDFTTLLLDIDPTYTTTGYPTGWTNYIVTLGGIASPVQGRLAFRYFVENGGPSGVNSNHIGIDTVAYYCNGTIPTPTPATPTPTPSVTPTPGTPVSSIAGTILLCSNPLPNVRINVTGAVARSELSDGSGNYWFRFLPYARTFTVTPDKAPLVPGATGIGTTDVIAIQRHFLNIFLIPPGCRLTAADVNADTRINTVDVIAVQRFFLTLTTGIANVGTYQFTPASRTYTGNGSNWTGENYDTVLIGDVAAPFVP